MATEVVIIATARKRSPGHDRRGGAAGPDRAQPTGRRAVRRAPGRVHGERDAPVRRAVVIDRHTRAPPGTGIVVGGAWGLGAPPTSTRPIAAHGAQYGSSTDLRSAARLMGYQASTMLTMLLNELLHSRRTPPLRVLRTVVSGARATRGSGRRHRRGDVPRPADRHGRQLTAAVRLLWRFHDRRDRAGLLARGPPGGRGGGLVPDSCQIGCRTTATDAGRRARSNSHRPRSDAVRPGRRARQVPVEDWGRRGPEGRCAQQRQPGPRRHRRRRTRPAG